MKAYWVKPDLSVYNTPLTIFGTKKEAKKYINGCFARMYGAESLFSDFKHTFRIVKIKILTDD